MSQDVARPQEPRTVLVVDDDEVFRTRLVRALDARGFIAGGAGSFSEAVEAARRETPEFAVVDLKLPGQSGLDVVRELKALDPATTVVILTGYGSIATAVQSVKLGAEAYLTKPVDADQIVAVFERPDAHSPAASPTTPTLARMEWEHIQRVLAECDGNVSQAARILGIHRRSLQRKLLKYPAPERC